MNWSLWRGQSVSIDQNCNAQGTQKFCFLKFILCISIYVCNSIYSESITETFLVTGKGWKSLKCLSIGDWLYSLYMAVKKNEGTVSALRKNYLQYMLGEKKQIQIVCSVCPHLFVLGTAGWSRGWIFTCLCMKHLWKETGESDNMSGLWRVKLGA